MADFFVGEIRLFPYNQYPKGWLPCEGQSLAINQYQALFALLGIQFGGDGKVNFNLPDLRGRVALGAGDEQQGTAGGAAAVTLKVAEMPAHAHQVIAGTGQLHKTNPLDSYLSIADAIPTSLAFNIYVPNPKTRVPLNSGSLLASIGGQPHENRQPLLALAFCIATRGLFPSRPGQSGTADTGKPSTTVATE